MTYRNASDRYKVIEFKHYEIRLEPWQEAVVKTVQINKSLAGFCLSYRRIEHD